MVCPWRTYPVLTFFQSISLSLSLSLCVCACKFRDNRTFTRQRLVASTSCGDWCIKRHHTRKHCVMRWLMPQWRKRVMSPTGSTVMTSPTATGHVLHIKRVRADGWRHRVTWRITKPIKRFQATRTVLLALNLLSVARLWVTVTVDYFTSPVTSHQTHCVNGIDRRRAPLCLSHQLRRIINLTPSSSPRSFPSVLWYCWLGLSFGL